MNGIYPLVNVNITMERSTIFNGKTHYKWAIFNSYVKLPEGIWIPSGKQFKKTIENGPFK